MANKKKTYERFGNFFCVHDEVKNKPETKKVILKKKDNIKKNHEVKSIHSEYNKGRKPPNPPEKTINIPPFLIEPNLQFKGTERSEPVDLIIGFDLGTAWTKVVIQDTARRRAVAVSFKEYGSKLNNYLLPTKLGFFDEHLALCKKDDKHNICNNLKISLIERPEQTLDIIKEKGITATGCETAAAFIAIVLRYVRYLFISSQADIYKNNYLRWQLNLGIPVKNYDNKEIKEAFHVAAMAGWLMSEKAGEITLKDAKKAIDRIKDKKFKPGINREYINVVPEVAAEVAGYAYSDMREEGLHLLVDIGATTLDVSTFILSKKDGEDRYGFLAAEIHRYGAFELHRARVTASRHFINSWLSKVDVLMETLEPVPESSKQYVPSQNEIPNFDEEFIKEAGFPITRVIIKTKKHRNPKDKAWKDGLPLFLCGGGSMAKFYSDNLIYNVNNSVTNNFNWGGFRLKKIPKPDYLEAEGLKEQEYHRLAVAYGLSFQYDNIGTIVPPSDIEDIRPDPKKKGYEDNFISKDMV